MNDKQAVAVHALRYVENGMVIGLGTGSTANYFIEALAQRHQQEKLHIQVVASSTVSMLYAQQHGLPLLAIEHLSKLDLYVDGADEVSPDLTVLKGRGSDLVKEKLLVEAADQFIVLIDASKQVDYIGEKFPIPAEVIPFAWQLVKQKMEHTGAQVTLRKTASGDGLAVTSHGSLVLDMKFDRSLAPAKLNGLMDATPGIVEHGIFLNLADSVLMATDGQVDERRAN